jgi:glycosyltransferase involved in cell wall biosynthesis
MRKLLQINVTANWGSTGKIAEQIGIVAQANGWNSYIAYGRYSCPSKNKTIRIGSKLEVIEHYVENRLFDNEGLASRRATRRFIQQIESIKPDIIHLHNIHDHYLNYEILFKYLAKLNIPIVWTLHDCWNFTGGCTYFDCSNCDSWKYECDNCRQKRAIVYDRTSYQFRNRRDLQNLIKNITFIPVSNWLKEYLDQSHQGYRNSIVIHNGVDLNTYKPIDVPQSKMVLGVANDWRPRKGLADFIKLRQILPEDFDIILVGLSQKQIKSLPDGIVGISRTSNQRELVKLYSQALAFVNPTYSDNFPTTNIEALACGTPVITYRTGGSPEAIDPSTGFVIEQGNIDSLKSAIEEIASTGKEKYSAKCRERAKTHFDKDVKYLEYINLYNKLIVDNAVNQVITPPPNTR